MRFNLGQRVIQLDKFAIALLLLDASKDKSGGGQQHRSYRLPQKESTPPLISRDRTPPFLDLQLARGRTVIED